MVLSSQQARPGANRSYLSSRRRGGKRKVIVVGMLIFGVGLLVWLMMRGADDDTAQDQDTTVAASNTDNQTPTPVPSHFETPPNPTPGPPVNDNPPPPSNGTNPPAPPAPIELSTDTAPPVAKLIREGRLLIQQNKLVAGRRQLNLALAGPISLKDELSVKREMAAINEKLIFSKLVEADDPFVQTHVLQPGEYLSTLAKQYNTPWHFIMRINNITDERRVPAHAVLKVVKGPFHCVVDKSDFRLDVFLSNEEGDMYIRSFPVGLGEYSSTPIGSFIVRRHSKLKDPEWVNPRTGQRFLGSNPDNPIGERWMGLQGTDDQTKLMRGYGLHGTIEPQSIGTESSMGCIRLLPDDINLLYDMLVGGKSKVLVKP